MRKKRKRAAPARNSPPGSESPSEDSIVAKPPEIGIAIGALLTKVGLDRVAVEPRPAARPAPSSAKPALVPDPSEPVTAPAARPRAEWTAGEFAALNQAYRGVEPIRRPKRARAVVATKVAVAPKAAHAGDESARERLSALVAGGQRFDVERDAAWVRGVRRGLSERLAERLSGARFEPEATLDLHGLRREAARREAREFVRGQHRRGARYLLIIVGKGTHSEDGVGVLADALIDELIGGVIAPLVEAFSSAHAQHGGTGSIAVQLSGPGRAPPKSAGR
jgi:DNA-nicking Smr family endonuclease